MRVRSQSGLEPREDVALTNWISVAVSNIANSPVSWKKIARKPRAVAATQNELMKVNHSRIKISPSKMIESAFISESLQTFDNSVGLELPTESDENEEEVLTTEQVLEEMRNSWQNEISAPVLLPHRFDAVDALVETLEEMEQSIEERHDKGTMKVAVHRMELVRISYIINDYVRIRLSKIEKNCRGALKEHNRRVTEGRAALLGEKELQFVKQFAVAEANLIASTFKMRLPVPFRKIAVADIQTQHERVFAQVTTEDSYSVEVPDYLDATGDGVIELQPHSVHLIPFNAIRDSIEEGRVRLL